MGSHPDEFPHHAEEGSMGAPQTLTQTGTVQSYNDATGHGFITASDGRRVYVHWTVIQGPGKHTLTAGQAVRFEANDSPVGLQATAVQAV
jgi:CspA family cold shock protein